MLQHGATVVRPGRIFLRHLYNLLTQTSHFKPHYSVRLASEPQADIEWWCTFIRLWNGSSILRPVRTERPDIEVWSDASGGWGCGVHWRSLWSHGLHYPSHLKALRRRRCFQSQSRPQFGVRHGVVAPSASIGWLWCN